MPVQVTITDESDFHWLQMIIQNSRAKVNSGKIPLEVGLMAERLLRDFEGATVVSQAEIAQALPQGTEEKGRSVSGEPKKTGKATRRSSEQVREETYVPNLCGEHPLYAGQRAPRKDCAGCWSAYKSLHPERYDLVRRNFERKAAE